MHVLRTAATAATATATTAALTAALGLVVGLATTGPAASSERMQLHCEDGRVIERANGSSWWDTETGAVLLTEHLVVSDGDDVVHEHSYGRKAPGAARTTCTAQHVGWTWTVQLVEPR
ncbi:MAG TPA: hypothetical protein VNU26_04945 [Mycobacteriales bacterium]|nr:hypothetical protein [Mycobacteriales bacterium]